MNNAAGDPLSLSEIQYYCRHQLYGTAIAACDTHLRKKGENGQITVLKAFAMTVLGQEQDAIRLLQPLRGNADFGLAALQVSRIAAQRSTISEKESLRQIDVEINAQSTNATPLSYYTQAIVLYFDGKYERARSCLERALSANPSDSMMLCLRGWIDVSGGRDLKTITRSFDQSAEGGFPDAFLGRAKLAEDRHHAAGIQDAISELMKRHAAFLPAHCERIKAAMMGRDWDAAAQLAEHALLLPTESVVVHTFQCTHAIAYAGKASHVEPALNDLLGVIEKVEPLNHQLCHRLAMLFASLALDSPAVLQFARRLLDKALGLAKKAEYLGGLGKIFLQMGQLKQAVTAFTAALELDHAGPVDESSIGIVRTYIAENRFDEAQSQLDFLKETHKDVANTTMFLYLQALIAKGRNQPFQDFLNYAKSALDGHLSILQGKAFDIEYLRILDADLLVEIVLQLFDFAPLAPMKTTDSTLKEIERVLNVVCEACPGINRSCYLLAKAKYLAYEMDAAEKLLRKCIEREQGMVEAHLLIAQINVSKNNFDEAKKSLDLGLSFNFKVRDHPLYHLIKARVQIRSNLLDAAAEQLRIALQLPAFKIEEKSKKRDKLEVNDSDRIAIYLELVECLQRLHKLEEAETVMNAAMGEWRGRPEEQQLILASGDLLVQRGSADAAIQILSTLTPEQPNYQAARIKIANIYLHEKKDKRQFAIIYKQLLERDPSPQAFVLLGDAYISIQEPARAIEVYETAIKSNPKDHMLAQKIGRAYVQCHLYAKAVSYYEAALKSGQQSAMRKDLADLLFRLGNFEKCERILRQALDKDKDPTDISVMSDHVAYWMQLSKLHFETGNWQEAIDELGKAKELQTKIIAAPISEGINVPEQRRHASKIICQLAELHSNQRELGKAIDLYKEALTLNDSDIKIMLSLAQLYLTMGKLTQCNQQCQAILTMDKNNDDATLMLADLMYQRNEIDQASLHFTQLLDRNPNQYHALARCIELSWRHGNVEQAEKYLKSSLDHNARATVDAGFNYCKGLHEWYTGEPNAALQAFNRARRDLEWGERAIYNMIEICLNPDNEIIGGEVLEHADDANAENDREMGTRTAQRFLKELRFKPGLDYKYRLMENFILLASNNRTNVQQALTAFAEMAGGEGPQDTGAVTNVGAILGLARGYMILKQGPKAKAQLKRVVGHTWTLEDADYLEQCWLLLADTYINQNKSEQATNILRTVLQHNASCIKAFECMGLLREKDQKWTDAAANYEEAWRLSKRKNPTIGYKLAYNYLKSRKLFDCIEVCHRVLQLYPNYPKIKKEILDKARANLRI